MKEFNATDMAVLLANKRVLILGDSVSEQHYIELQSMLVNQIDKLKSEALLVSESRFILFKNISKNRVITSVFALKNNCSIYYIRSDILVNSKTYKIQEKFNEEEDYNSLWAHVAKKADIIIFNSGLHISTSWNLSRAIENMLKYFTILLEKNPNLTVIFRTSVPGAKGCQKNKTVPDLPTDFKYYNWHLLRVYDKIWKEKVKEIWKGEWFWLNITDLSNYRSDARVRPPEDCVHFCIPGPIRTWNQILYNQLYILNLRKDTKILNSVQI